VSALRDLSGRVAVVTGAAGGIGFALAARFVDEGMRVVLSDVDEERLEAAAGRLSGEVLAVVADVRSWSAVDELAARTLERFGSVHVLCNNAGVQLPAKTWELSREEWEWVLGVSWGGVVHGIKSFVPGMVARGEPGHVVNIASVGGLVAFPTLAAYTAAKYAVVGLSEVLALDLRAEGAPIGVSCVCPGPTVSALRENSARLGPSGRNVPSVGELPRIPAEDVADAVVAGIKGNRFWVLTHPAYGEQIRARTEAMLDSGEVLAARIA
jgi:NAD(P)-dependent dehydrogenase (short-subunit alcohol dehydrogenase family)